MPRLRLGTLAASRVPRLAIPSPAGAVEKVKPAAFTCCRLHTLCPYPFSAYAILIASGTPSPRPWARNVIKANPNATEILTSYVPGDYSAEGFYLKVGFQHTGRPVHGEPEMRLELRARD